MLLSHELLKLSPHPPSAPLQPHYVRATSSQLDLGEYLLLLSSEMKQGIKGSLRATSGDTVLYIKAKFNFSSNMSRAVLRKQTGKKKENKLFFVTII